MIITRQKPLEEILALIGVSETVFIIGCNVCAKLCKTGGPDETDEIKDRLEAAGKKVTGTLVLDPACHLQKDKQDLKAVKRELDEADCILAFSCGTGAQTVGEALDRIVISGNDSLFSGEITTLREFEEKCKLCGQCLLGITGGLCPIARCPKMMLNGPCGGTIDGKCELGNDKDCVWFIAYQRLKDAGRLDLIRGINEAKDWNASKGQRSARAEK